MLFGHGHGQPAVGNPALSRGVVLHEFQSRFLTSATLYFCDRHCASVFAG